MTHRKRTRNRSILRLCLAFALMMVLITMTQQETSQASGVTPSAVECPVNMISYWKLDEAQGPPYVDFKGVSDGVCQGACPTPTDGKVSGAQSFNPASATRVNIPDDDAFDWNPDTDFSIEFWMRTDGDTTCAGNQVVVGRDAPATESNLHWWVGCAEGGTAAFTLWDTENTPSTGRHNVSGDDDISDGEWHHVVAMHMSGPNRLRIYVDGVQDGGAAADTYTGDFGSAQPINVGWLNYSPSLRFYFDGDIDELAFYRRMLTDDEIAQHYNAGNGRPYCDSANISLEKTASETLVRAGETVLYSYAVTNDGNEDLNSVSLTDDTCTGIQGPTGDTGVMGRLEQGETWNYTCSQALFTTTTNTATAAAISTTGVQVSAIDTATVQVINPAIEFTKTADPTVVYVNGRVDYTYTVENKGDVALTNTSIVDDTCSPVAGPQGNTGTAALDPGETWTYICADTLTVDTTNTATFTAWDPSGNQVTATDTATVDVIDPSMTLSKSAPSYAVIGDPVTYTYIVTNNGDDPLTGLTLADDKCSVNIGPQAALAPTQSRTFTCSQSLTQDTTNTATAEAFDSKGAKLTATATATVDVIDPSITLVKTANEDKVVSGDTVVYTYQVTNDGDVVLTNVVVGDDTCTAITGPTGNTGTANLDPAETWTYTCSQALTQSTTNTATATASHPAGGTVTDTDTATVEVIHPSITLTKSASSESVEPGDIVLYTYLVTNNGDDLLTNVALTDDKCSPLIRQPGNTGTANLDPQESWLYTCSQQLNEETTNVATVTATDSLGNTLTATDSVTVRMGVYLLFLPTVVNQ